VRPRRRTIEAPRRRVDTTPINDAINFPQVRLVGPSGEQLGIRAAADAREYAYERDLDLVVVAAQADPPVCRVMDYGKHRYQEEQKAKQARKRQAQTSVKEVRLRPKTASHDYAWKRDRVAGFLGSGHKVKVVVLLRGRERDHPERGSALLLQFAADLDGVGRAESVPLNEGRSLSLVISPAAASPARS
jgi:translation initiation factor IF-3